MEAQFSIQCEHDDNQYVPSKLNEKLVTISSFTYRYATMPGVFILLPSHRVMNCSHAAAAIMKWQDLHHIVSQPYISQLSHCRRLLVMQCIVASPAVIALHDN